MLNLISIFPHFTEMNRKIIIHLYMINYKNYISKFYLGNEIKFKKRTREILLK